MVIKMLARKRENVNKNNRSDSGHRSERPRTGEPGILRIPAGGDVLVATSQEARDRLFQLVGAKDAIGVSKMMMAGLVWSIPSGTKCHVIQIGVFTYEVRLMEGDHAGDACFVSSDFVSSE